MSWFSKLFSNPDVAPAEVKANKHTIVLAEAAPKRVWRNNMWVMTPDGVGIIFTLGEPVIVHLVNTSNGETIKSAKYSSNQLRQAKYEEIPAMRRGDKQKALMLGYE